MTTAETTKRERIRVDRSQLERYRELAGIGEHAPKGGTGTDLTPFRSLKDVFMLAVCLGKRAGKRTPLKSREDLIYVNYLNDHTDLAVLQCIALAEGREIEVLGNLNLVCTVAEEYANTGFEELYATLTGKGKALINLVSLLVESCPETQTK